MKEHCKKLDIVIESNQTCIDCGSYDFCREDNRRPYEPSTKDKVESSGFWIVVLALCVAFGFLVLRLLIDFWNGE